MTSYVFEYLLIPQISCCWKSTGKMYEHIFHLIAHRTVLSFALEADIHFKDELLREFVFGNCKKLLKSDKKSLIHKINCLISMATKIISKYPLGSPCNN